MNGFDYAHARFLTSPVPVRRALAAECAAFLRDLDGKEEIWHPYRTWASSLDPQWDTVISFNYDRRARGTGRDDKSKLKICCPVNVRKVRVIKRSHAGCRAVLKLHGIVDWKKNDSGEIVQGEWKEILADEMHLRSSQRRDAQSRTQSRSNSCLFGSRPSERSKKRRLWSSSAMASSNGHQG